MRNKITSLIFAAFLTLNFLPLGVVSAIAPNPTSPQTQTPTPTPTSQPIRADDPNCKLDGTTTKICNPLANENIRTAPQLVVWVLQKIFALIGIIAVLMIVIAGFQMVAMASDEKAYGKAKGTVTNAVIGLALAALAYTIVAVLQNILY